MKILQTLDDKDWDVPVWETRDGIKRVFSRPDNDDMNGKVAPMIFRADLEFVRQGRRSSATPYFDFRDGDDKTLFRFFPAGVASLFQGIRDGSVRLTRESRLRGIYITRKKQFVRVEALDADEVRQFDIDF